jgi:hypothetical protein
MNRLFAAILCLLLGASFTAAAAPVPAAGKALADTLPEPRGVRNMMFYLQRNPNANTVVYELNKTAQGGLDEQAPIHPYWIRYADGGERKELSYIQSKFAYGLKTRKLGKDNYELKFVCYNKLALYLRRAPDGRYQVYTTINQKEAVLDRIFVRIEGGTFWVPNVLYVELQGREAATGKIIAGRFKP